LESVIDKVDTEIVTTINELLKEDYPRVIEPIENFLVNSTIVSKPRFSKGEFRFYLNGSFFDKR